MRSTSVSPKPVADHIIMLGERYGATHLDIARAAGVDERSIRHILDTRYAPENKRGVYVRTAVKIMSVRALPPGHRLVDGTGTQRRAEALSAMGWTRKEVSRRAGLSDSTLHPSKLGKNVWFSTELAVRDVYEQLRWKVSPGRQSGPTRAIARRLGYVPPWAWKNGTIDDPLAKPLLNEIENKEWHDNVKKRYFTGNK